MNNRNHLKNATESLNAILAYLKENNAMMDAGRIGGRYDELGECQDIVEDILKQCERLDHLL